jgi:hypothetical protein
MVRLDDGRRVAVDPGTIWEEPGRGLRATVPSASTSRPVSVRFSNRAQMDLAPSLERDGDETVIVVGSHRRAIPDHPPPT